MPTSVAPVIVRRLFQGDEFTAVYVRDGSTPTGHETELDGHEKLKRVVRWVWNLHAEENSVLSFTRGGFEDFGGTVVPTQ